MPNPADPTLATADPIEAAIRSSIAAVEDGDAALIPDTLDDDIAVVEEPAVPAVDDPAADVPAVVADPAVAAPVAPAAVVPDAAAVAAKADADLDISKVPPRGANGRVNTIPQPRVVKMVERSVAKAKEEWTKTVVTPLTTKVQTYETRLKGIADTENLMFGTLDQKKQFLSQLAASVPGYAELLGAAVKPGTTAPPAAAAVDDANDPEPKPDVIENGVAVGWTEAGLAKMRAWDRRSAARDAVAAAETALVKKYGLDKMHGRFSEVEMGRQTLNEINQAIDVAAATWPGFKENAVAINAALVGNVDPRFGLKEAYNQVLFGLATRASTTEQELEATLRTKIADELARAPRSTSAAATGISTRAAEEVVTTDDPIGDAIRRSIRGLK